MCSLEICQRRYANLGVMAEMPAMNRRSGQLPFKDHTGNVRSKEITTVDDTSLARAGERGEAWAEKEIWDRFAPMVYTFLRRTAGSQLDAEDLLQEVFVRVFERLRTLQDPAALRSFIYSIAIRVLNEELRRKSIRSRLTSLFLAPFLRSSVAHVDFESRDALRRIQGVLDAMHPRLRAVFVLRRFEDFELTEIAASLGLSLATVKRDMDKAHKSVARLIRDDDRLSAVLECDVARRGREDGR
jgi:RNA polymerase sigma-70 factor, ECF subfamily